MTSQIAAYLIAIMFLILSESFVRQKASKSFRTASRRLDKTTLLYVASIFFILLSAPFLSALNIFPIHNYSAGWWGIGILLLGLVVRTVAMVELGEYYTRALITTREQKVVATGLYKYVRHPGYAGTILAGIGFGLAQLNLLTLGVIVLLLSLVYAKRIPVEEKVLLQNLGFAYSDYSRRTKRLIPFVY